MKSTTTVIAAISAAIGAAAHPGHSRRAVPVGQVITSCTAPGTVALTFDDGPYDFTNSVLDKLEAAGHRATFFLNGQNLGSIFSYSAQLQRMVNGRHQIGSHTWSHADLSLLDAAGIESEMKQLDDALQTLVGFKPKYMRPPYLAVNDATLATLGQLGYVVTSVDIDTLDWANKETPNVAIDNYITAFNAGGRLSLAHDIHQNTVDNIVPKIIEFLATKSLKSVTVAECLGETLESAYNRGSVSSSVSARPSSSALPSSQASSAVPSGSASPVSPSSANPSATRSSVVGPSGSVQPSSSPNSTGSTYTSGALPSATPSRSGGSGPLPSGGYGGGGHGGSGNNNGGSHGGNGAPGVGGSNGGNDQGNSGHGGKGGNGSYNGGKGGDGSSNGGKGGSGSYGGGKGSDAGPNSGNSGDSPYSPGHGPKKSHCQRKRRAQKH